MNMRLLTPPADDDKFYVDRPYYGFGFDTVGEARRHAGVLQLCGSHQHSIRIYQNGKCVDLKRY